MNKTETGEILRSNVRARMYQPAAMLVHGIALMPVKNSDLLMAVGGIARYDAEDIRDFNGTAFLMPMSHSLVRNSGYGWRSRCFFFNCGKRSCCDYDAVGIGLCEIAECLDVCTNIL